MRFISGPFAYSWSCLSESISHHGSSKIARINRSQAKPLPDTNAKAAAHDKNANEEKRLRNFQLWFALPPSRKSPESLKVQLFWILFPCFCAFQTANLSTSPSVLMSEEPVILLGNELLSMQLKLTPTNYSKATLTEAHLRGTSNLKSSKIWVRGFALSPLVAVNPWYQHATNDGNSCKVFCLEKMQKK